MLVAFGNARLESDCLAEISNGFVGIVPAEVRGATAEVSERAVVAPHVAILDHACTSRNPELRIRAGAIAQVLLGRSGRRFERQQDRDQGKRKSPRAHIPPKGE